MKLLSTLFCAALIGSLAVSARAASSWEDEKQAWDELSRARDYKDPGYAAKLSLGFFPVDNGHFYVGDVKKGVWFSVGQTASLAALAVPILNSQSRSRQDLRPVWTDAMVAVSAVGAVGYVGLKVWSAFSAAAEARRFNAARAEAREKGAWHWSFEPSGVRVSASW